MAETITIPSPSVFLRSPVQSSAAKPPAKTSPKRPSVSTKPSVNDQSQNNGVTKRKQSKSRNGCITCKAKRLKCDETKPSCQQCARRSVTCGGYKKDFKWRPFEETNLASKAPGKPKKSQSPTTQQAAPVHSQNSPPNLGSLYELPTDYGPFNEPAYFAQDAHGLQASGSDMLDSALIASTQPLSFSHPFTVLPRSMQHDDQPEPPSASSTTVFTDMDTLHSATTGPSTLSPEDSPRLADLLPPSNDMDMQSPDFTPIGPQYEAPLYHPASGATEHLKREVREDDVEEIARQPPVSAGQESWVMGIPSPAPSSTSSSSSETTVKVITEPQLPSGGPEMLMLRFDRQTCGILSVKDGPTENPWRTLIWPLARDNKALYHAIASMTSFHASKHAHELRVQGISHMHSCFRALRTTGMENMPVDTAIATALVLGFAESWDQHTSTGINHIKGAKALVNQALIQHRHSPLQGEKLRRLRFLCNTWVYMDVIARLTSFDDDDTTDFDHVINLSPMPLSSTPMFPSAPQSPMLVSDGVIDASLDPLMGFASTLFPIIGRVANLVRRVRRTSCNSPAIISAAVSLKTALEEWIPPPLSAVEDPEDPSSNVQHNLQTAEAYRWATLLYLHQAVPEIPSLSSTELGKKVLGILATVPLSSRAVIVQIFPLTAGGCEAMDDETRQWVRDRWENMGRRMKIGVIDRCAEVCSEVWRRRDEYEVVCQARSARSSTGLVNRFSRELTSPDTFCNDLFGMDEGLDSRAFALHAGHPEGSTRRKTTNRLTEQARMRIAHDWTRKQSRDAITGEVDPEYTIRGSLHWLGVMKDWDWEVLLG